MKDGPKEHNVSFLGSVSGNRCVQTSILTWGPGAKALGTKEGEVGLIAGSVGVSHA